MISSLDIRDQSQWHSLRMQDVTASVAACLVGHHPYTTRYELFHEKRKSFDGEDTVNLNFRDGHILEPAVVKLIEAEYPSWMIEYPLNKYLRWDAMRIGATPDAYVIRPDMPGKGNMQLKTVGKYAFQREWHNAETGEPEVPTWIAVQSIIEGFLSGSAWAGVAAMVVDRPLQLHIFDVPLHEPVFKRLADLSRKFMATVESGDEPPIDWQRDVPVVLEVYAESVPTQINLADDETFGAIVARYAEHTASIQDGTNLRQDLGAKILRMMGDSERALSATSIVTARTRRSERDDGSMSRSRTIRIKERHDV